MGTGQGWSPGAGLRAACGATPEEVELCGTTGRHGTAGRPTGPEGREPVRPPKDKNDLTPFWRPIGIGNA